MVGTRKPKATSEREQTIRLSRRDCARLLDLLDNPPQPNDRLRAAMKQYAKIRHTDADNSFDWRP
jgi:uncharacterized protein (DUF1778 family)